MANPGKIPQKHDYNSCGRDAQIILSPIRDAAALRRPEGCSTSGSPDGTRLRWSAQAAPGVHRGLTPEIMNE